MRDGSADRDGDDHRPVVSICCITFNHERYLAQALDSFLSQETDFPFEVLVHDDASTDGTADIVRDYMARYPGQVRAVLQVVNQYSLGRQIYPTLFEMARGEYIAWCEGDDFFTDVRKIQRQVDFLSANPDYSLSTHEAVLVSEQGRPVGHVRPADSDRRLTTEAVIEGGGGMIATNSMIFRAEFARSLPGSFHRCSVGDYPMAVHLALNGKVHYMATPMSAYRAAYNNWTHMIARDPRRRLANHENMLETLRGIDEASGGEFHDAVDRAATWHDFEIATLTGRIDRLGDPRFASLYSDAPPLRRAAYRFRTRFPRLGSQLSAVRRDATIRVNELREILRSARRS